MDAASARALAAGLLLFSASVGAQGVTVVGYVADTSATPVPAAEVRVDGTSFRARTDDRGAFLFTGVRPGPFTITVQRLGFAPRRDLFQARAGDTLQVILDLTAVPVGLATVKVTGARVRRRSPVLDDFERRRAAGFGAFVTREDVARRNPRLTSDLFRTLTGVTVIPVGGRNELRMTRSLGCAPDIYIDGLEAREYRIDDLSPMDVAGIEVFRGPSEVPASFRRLWVGCGVVSIWTRVPGS